MLRYWRDERAAIALTLAITFPFWSPPAAWRSIIAASRRSTPSSRMPPTRPRWPPPASSTAPGARDRATDAARDLVRNLTYFANDDDTDGRPSGSPSNLFYRPTIADGGTKARRGGRQRRGRQLRQGDGGDPPRQFCFTPSSPRSAATRPRRFGRSRIGLLQRAAVHDVPARTEDFNPDDHIGDGLRLVIGGTCPGQLRSSPDRLWRGAANLGRAIG